MKIFREIKGIPEPEDDKHESNLMPDSDNSEADEALQTMPADGATQVLDDDIFEE